MRTTDTEIDLRTTSTSSHCLISFVRDEWNNDNHNTPKISSLPPTTPTRGGGGGGGHDRGASCSPSTPGAGAQLGEAKHVKENQTLYRMDSKGRGRIE